MKSTARPRSVGLRSGRRATGNWWRWRTPLWLPAPTSASVRLSSAHPAALREGEQHQNLKHLESIVTEYDMPDEIDFSGATRGKFYRDCRCISTTRCKSA